MAEAVLFSEDCLLAYTGLYVLVHVRIGETEHQPVCPTFVHNTRFGHNGFVVVSIIETLHAHLLTFVETARLKILYRHIYMIIVVRVVLKGIDFIAETVLESLSEVNV